ncbi:MAG: hypothetical protein LBF26_03110, partial [Puniceicoccales bacterium]|nr:hypothetical protein [Puniceicoccales bacterium]
MESSSGSMPLHARVVNHPIAGIIGVATGLIGAIATAPLCFGLLAIPAILSSVVPFLLPAFVLACCVFAVGTTMVGYHLFTRQPKQKDD